VSGSPGKVLVVVLNWRAPDQSGRCARSALGSVGADVDVLIVENGSGDGSADELRAAFGADRVAVRSVNGGYAGGMNEGLDRWLAHGEAPFALLATQDVVFDPAAIAELVRAMEANPRLGVVGPIVHLAGDETTLITAGGMLDPRRLRTDQRRAPPAAASSAGTPYPVDWVDGCCQLLRRDAIQSVGGLDERYFMYFEDVDLCRRLVERGWEAAVAPRARVAQEKPHRRPARYPYFMARNRYHFWREHYGAGILRVGLRLALDTGRNAVWTAAAQASPAVRRGRDASLATLGRELVGALRGTRDYLMGRMGPEGGRPASGPAGPA
jgi:GT2 family glycosyltransferase